jgi:hypothetical protein
VKFSIKPSLLFAAFILVLSPCYSQEDSTIIFSLDSIAFSSEFKIFANAENNLFNFIATRKVDMEAMDRVAEGYTTDTGDEPSSAEIFKGVPNAVELYQLILDRSEAVKIVDRKFGYLSLPIADRKAIRKTYRAANPFILSAVETDEALDRHKKH